MHASACRSPIPGVGAYARPLLPSGPRIGACTPGLYVIPICRSALDTARATKALVIVVLKVAFG